ncbi:MAG: RpiB/LacA/LacB family sugar-phosphate isomerase [Chloroflexota bacterium]|nr:RpiB/LacA/LacB family sugar-phosphate isomerase [Chloroflexota bacterium]
MRVALASDHAGLPLKAPIADWLRSNGHEVLDFGVDSDEPVDYPDVIAPAARAVAAGDCQLGVVLGGSGTGEQIVANKIRGIRCVEATDPVTARLAREHNDANVLAMGARIIASELAVGCVAAFVGGRFAGGRHARRVAKISALEAAAAGAPINAKPPAPSGTGGPD